MNREGHATHPFILLWCAMVPISALMAAPNPSCDHQPIQHGPNSRDIGKGVTRRPTAVSTVRG
mgnify:CR=1 FL=1